MNMILSAIVAILVSGLNDGGVPPGVWLVLALMFYFLIYDLVQAIIELAHKQNRDQ